MQHGLIISIPPHSHRHIEVTALCWFLNRWIIQIIALLLCVELGIKCEQLYMVDFYEITHRKITGVFHKYVVEYLHKVKGKWERYIDKVIIL